MALPLELLFATHNAVGPQNSFYEPSLAMNFRVHALKIRSRMAKIPSKIGGPSTWRWSRPLHIKHLYLKNSNAGAKDTTKIQLAINKRVMNWNWNSKQLKSVRWSTEKCCCAIWTASNGKQSHTFGQLCLLFTISFHHSDPHFGPNNSQTMWCDEFRNFCFRN